MKLGMYGHVSWTWSLFCLSTSAFALIKIILCLTDINIFLILLCSMLPRSTHETFAQKLYQSFKNNKRFSKPKLSRSDFIISHYAGDVSTLINVILFIHYDCQTRMLANNKSLKLLFLIQVTYQTEFFLDKNKDYVVAEHQALLTASKCSFVSSLFPPLSEDASKSSKFSSIGARFKVQQYFFSI